MVGGGQRGGVWGPSRTFVDAATSSVASAADVSIEPRYASRKVTLSAPTKYARKNSPSLSGVTPHTYLQSGRRREPGGEEEERKEEEVCGAARARWVRGASRAAPVRINRDRQHGRQPQQQRRAEAVLLDVRRQRAEPPRLRHRRLAEDLEPEQLLLQVGAAEHEVERRADRRTERRDNRTLRQARRGVRVGELRAELRAGIIARRRIARQRMSCAPSNCARAWATPPKRTGERAGSTMPTGRISPTSVTFSTQIAPRKKASFVPYPRPCAYLLCGHGPRGGQRIAQKLRRNCAEELRGVYST